MITKVLLSAGSHEELYKGVQALREYDDFKYTLLNDPIFVRSCEALDSRVEPTSAQDIMAALRLHPSSGAYGMSLFDEIICYSFISDYHGQGEAEKHFHELKGVAIAHLTSIYSYCSPSVIKTNTIKNSINLGQTVDSEAPRNS